MSEKNLIAVSVVVGALVGGLVGFLLFTQRGKQFRAEIQPHIDEFGNEMRDLQNLAARVRSSANDSWQQIDSFLGEWNEPRRSWADDTKRH